MPKYQSIHAERNVKLSTALVKTNLLCKADENLKQLFLDPLSEAEPSAETSSLKTVVVHEFKLLEMNEKALQNLLAARAKVLERLQNTSVLTTAACKAGVK